MSTGYNHCYRLLEKIPEYWEGRAKTRTYFAESCKENSSEYLYHNAAATRYLEKSVEIRNGTSNRI